jgi:hypothetical protein
MEQVTNYELVIAIILQVCETHQLGQGVQARHTICPSMYPWALLLGLVFLLLIFDLLKFLLLLLVCGLLRNDI